MIIILLTILVLLFSALAIFAPTGTIRNVSIGLVGLILVLLTGLTMANDLNHFGMHQQTEITTEGVTSLSGGKPETIAEKRIGTADEKLVVYRTNKRVKPQKTTLKNTKTTISRSTDKRAMVKITTDRWVYNNGVYRWLFALTNEEEQIASRQYQFILPKNWRKVPVD